MMAEADRAMMASVDLDVVLEIITEGVQLARVFTAEAHDEFREHVRDQVLASKGEGCGDLVRLAVSRQGKGLAGESGGTGRDTSGDEGGCRGRTTYPNGGQRLLDRQAIGSSLVHGAQVEVEVCPSGQRRTPLRRQSH